MFVPIPILVLMFIIIGLLGYAVVNLLGKYEQAEKNYEKVSDDNDKLFEWYETFKKQIEDTNLELKRIDRKGSFESDDETGFIFKQIKEVIENLNNLFSEK